MQRSAWPWRSFRKKGNERPWIFQAAGTERWSIIIPAFLMLIPACRKGQVLDQVKMHEPEEVSAIMVEALKKSGNETKLQKSYAYPLPSRACFLDPELSHWFSEPFDIPAFTVRLSERISGTRDLPGLLHLAHLLNHCSAGGYGPPLASSPGVTGASTAHRSTSPDMERFTAGPEEGGLGLVWDQAISESFMEADPFLRSILLDLMDLACQLAGIMQHVAGERELEAFLAARPCEPGKPLVETCMLPYTQAVMNDNLHRKLFASIDLELLGYASRLAAKKLERIIRDPVERKELPAGKEKTLSLQTAFGRIVLLTHDRDTLEEPCFIALDPGGDDLYLSDVAVSTGPMAPLGICIDLGGNDRYGDPAGNSRVCSSALGMSILYDLSGDDIYSSRAYGLAFSLGGCAILEDISGNDHYESFGDFTQAAACFGYALLWDRAGNDIYQGGSYGQGFGTTRGTGILIDEMGKDSYLAPGGSFVQGAAKGRWADASDGFNMDGGTGLLYDHSGDDLYQAASFSQGASYFLGLGILTDRSGNDRYQALTHSQGAAVHASLACFADMGGNDRYNSESDTGRLTQSMGYGRDRSHAFFLEFAGDDSYLAGNRSFGTGDITATGVVLELGGNDSYTWVRNRIYAGSRSFGSTQHLGPGMASHEELFMANARGTLGIFLDLEGRDEYTLLEGGIVTGRFFRNRKTDRYKKTDQLSIRTDR